MKALLIKVNFLISLFGLTIDPDHSSFIAVLILFAYFMISAMLFIYAQDKGWLYKSSEENKTR